MRNIRTTQVEFDSARQVRESAVSLIVPAIIARECVSNYCGGRGYKPGKELKAAAFTLEGAWVVAYKHIDTIHVHNRFDIRGRIENVKFNDEINGVIGDIHFLKEHCDQALLEDLKKGTLPKDVSAAYYSNDIYNPGKFGDDAYDFVQQDIMFGHVAIGVVEGRCPSPFCGLQMDSFDGFLRVIVRDPSVFTCRLSTLAVDAKAGIYALVGKLKSKLDNRGLASGDAFAREFLFETSKGWTPEKADAWVKEHKDEAVDSILIHMDPEVTEKYVRIRVRDPNLFVDGSFRMIVLSADQGIHAIIGKLKSDPGGSTVIQNYMFELAKDWTMEKAQAWVKEHKDQMDQEQGEREKLREEAAKRCARTPIKFNEGKGHLTKPEEYPNVPDEDFADPCNYAYPMVPEDRLRAAWQRLHQEENRAAGGYTSEEWEWMKNRVEKRLKEKGVEVKADSLDPVEVLAHSRKLLSSR